MRAFCHGLLRLVFRDRYVSLQTLAVLRALLPLRDPFFSEIERAVETEDAEALRDLGIDDYQLGPWSASPSTIALSAKILRASRPELVFEFGSGVSTLALARLMMELHEDSELRVISVEQDADFRDTTQRMLMDGGVGGVAEVIYRPLVVQDHFGRTVRGYDLSPRYLESLLGAHAIDAVFIDGPTGEPGIRLGTLPLVAPYMRDPGLFLMDDALRDGELEVAGVWARRSEFTIRGVLLTDRGLLVGQVARPLDGVIGEKRPPHTS